MIPAHLGAIAARNQGGLGASVSDNDPHIASVISLLHFDGADAATTFTDDRPGSPSRVWTANGNAQIDTAQSMFGGASGLFDGAGDYINTPDHADFAFGTGDFTIELCARWASLTGQQFMVTQFGINATTLAFRILKDTTNVLNAHCGDGVDGTIGQCISTVAVTTNVWYHIAYVRTGKHFGLYLDGALIDYAESSSAILNSTSDVVVGRNGAVNGGYMNGWLDDLRITKGVARYTQPFNRPSAAFPNT